MFGVILAWSAACQPKLAEFLKGGTQQVRIVADPDPQAGEPGIADGSDSGKILALAQDQTADQAAGSDHLMPFLHRK